MGRDAPPALCKSLLHDGSQYTTVQKTGLSGGGRKEAKVGGVRKAPDLNPCKLSLCPSKVVLLGLGWLLQFGTGLMTLELIGLMGTGLRIWVLKSHY